MKDILIEKDMLQAVKDSKSDDIKDAKSLMNKTLMMQRLFGPRMTKGTKLCDHIDYFLSLCVELQKFEDELPEDSKSVILVNSLPPIYKNLVMTMLHGTKMPSLDEAISTLLEFEQRQSTSYDASGQGLFVQGGKEKSRPEEKGKPIEKKKGRAKSKANWLKNQECHGCHEKGHFRKDCPKNTCGKMKNGGTSFANVVKDGDGEDGEVYSALVAVEQLADTWILDSGCSYHMYPHANLFESYKSSSGMVSMGNNAPCKVVGMGNVKVQMFEGVVRTLGDVRHVPDL